MSLPCIYVNESCDNDLSRTMSANCCRQPRLNANPSRYTLKHDASMYVTKNGLEKLLSEKMNCSR